MSKVLVNETSLTGIAAAIREKNGETTTYKPNEMAAAIAALEVGGSGDDGVPNPIIYTGDVERALGGNHYNWLIENYSDRIQTKDITRGSYFFGGSDKLEVIPFDINVSGTTTTCMSMFSGCYELKSIGKITAPLYNLRSMFYQCYNLRNLPEMDLVSYSYIDSNGLGDMFSHCYSLREIPETLLAKLQNPSGGTGSNGVVYSGFKLLYTIDEITGIPVVKPTLTSNVFSNVFQQCHRLKKITFATDNGTPYTANWKYQVIDLHDNVGWDAKSISSSDYPVAEGKLKNIVGYNSGITNDKFVNTLAKYEALKDDPDWYSNSIEYSRFNHQSCVDLINSLPDTSAYLETQSGATNSIIFYPYAGRLTDEGSCDKLTDVEIAIATSKGWTVSYKTT